MLFYFFEFNLFVLKKAFLLRFDLFDFYKKIKKVPD